MPPSRLNRPSATARVSAITVTPVKGLALENRQSVMLGPAGVVVNRAFFLVDDRGRMVNGKALGSLVQVHASVSDDLCELELRFPDGMRLRGPVELGPLRRVQFFRAQFDAPSVAGPWAEALSAFCGRPVDICRAPADRPGVDRGMRGSVSMVSSDALDALRNAGDVPEPIDPRRFRLLFLLDGIAAHAEDAWCGQTIGIGAARVAVNGLVGRCAVTTRDPDTGVVDLPTLHYIQRYRGDIRAEERLPFGVFGEVVTAGEVCVGDPVLPPDEASRLE